MPAGESPDRWPSLTPRQDDVLRHLLAGRSDKEIAAELHISPHTVHNHVKALYRTFGVSRRPGLFARCLELHAAETQPSNINRGEIDREPDPWSAPADDARTILENAPDFILELERDGTIRFINRVYPIHRREDVIGSNVADWIAPDELRDFRQALDEAFQTGRPQACEHSVPSMSVSGATPHFRIRLNPVEEGGRISRVICVSRETTQKRGES